MKVFLTGATGFTGSAVLKALLGAGHSVTGLAQDEKAADIIKKAGGAPVIGDLLVPEPWKDSVQESDLVISASSPYHMGEKMSITEAARRAETHAEEVGNLLHAAKGSKVQGVVLTYHVTALGNQGDRWASEILTIDPVGLARPLAAAYWDIEKAARKAGVPIIEVFPGWVYGPGSWFEHYIVNELRAGNGRIIGAGSNYFSLIHINDLAEGFRLIVDKLPLGERFCLVDGHPVTQRELVGYVASLMGAPLPENVDYEAYSKVMGEVMAEAMDSSVRVTNSKAKKELGFRPRFESYTEGIPEVLKSLGIQPAMKEIPKASGF